MKKLRLLTAAILVLCFMLSVMPAFAVEAEEPAEERTINSGVIIDDDATGGYEGDYVVIYNPGTSTSTVSTGTLTGLIETTVSGSVNGLKGEENEPAELYKVDVDSLLAEKAKDAKPVEAPADTRASYNVGDTKTFSIYSSYSPTGSGSVQFECLYVGSHCYIWTPVSSSSNTYPLDEIDSSFAQMAANEFDSKFDLMQSSFGNHTNGSNGDGKLHMLYYNINDGWQPGQGYVAGFFYQGDISNNGLPILNIDTYPGVYYQSTSGTVYKRMDDTYNTMVHEYQHLINYSNTSGMSSWLNECFSAAAEEICYPGSSIVSRIQSWENYSYATNDDWLTPPTEFEYQSSNSLHKGYSLYNWSNSLDNTSLLTLYSQVSFFAQYLYTRFGNAIYKQISSKYSYSEVTAITNATGVSCSDLARDFRVAIYANAAESLGTNYGFKVQNGYDPSQYHDVTNPYNLLGPVVFTGTSCSIGGGGAICVKPVNGVFNPPSGASSSLKYIGIKLNNYTVTAVSNNTNYGTVSVNGTTITASPANGYYVESCTLVSGTATWTINGNTIAVSASSDCTIRVNFAPKPTYTVNFVASGVAQGSQSALVYDEITLPSTVTVNPEGWTFSGWVEMQIEETTDEPAYYAPGAAYTVTGNATLYALYTREDEGGTETVYALVTSTPSSWAGNYVITNNTTNLTTSGMYVLKGVTGSSSGTNAESASNCTAFASTGITLDDNKLYNVTNTYVMILAASGSYYTVQSAATGCYYGMNSSSYLYAYSSVNSTYCRWTPAVNTSSVAQLKNAANGTYPYFGWSTSNTYFWSASSTNANALRLWKETEVSSTTTYYCTDPVSVQPTEYTVTFVDWDGTVLKTETVIEGGSATPPADPTRVGYTFAGWSGNYTNVQGDVTITATYTINSYTVTFVDWDGTVLKTETVNYGGAATAPANPTRVGYTFNGWDVAFNNVTGDLTVTAQYQINSYTLTINYVDEDGNPVAAPYVATLNYGQGYAVNSPVVEGYSTEQTYITGNMGAENVTITVVYTADPIIEPGLIGDVDCDGDIDFDDVTLLNAYLLNAAELSEQGLANANVNGDNKVSSADVVALNKLILGSN